MARIGKSNLLRCILFRCRVTLKPIDDVGDDIRAIEIWSEAVDVSGLFVQDMKESTISSSSGLFGAYVFLGRAAMIVDVNFWFG